MYSELIIPSLRLENDTVLKEPTIGYHTFGRLNAAKSNVIWVCHGLTANSDVASWWEGLFGENKLFSPDAHFIVCANALGSCYGTTGPSTPSKSEVAQLDQFPTLTTRDQVTAHESLRKELGIEKIHLLVGASLGGQQALEWSIINQSLVNNLLLIATNARHSAYGIAFNESQRMAIQADPTYGNGQIDGGKSGLAVARSIAMLSYRSYDGYVQTQTESCCDKREDFRASSYQNYQGDKLANRFDAYAYVTLSKAMDSHNVGRGRKSINNALSLVEARTLVIGVSSDQLFPTKEQKYLANHIPNADYVEIDSAFGHDGFLIETEQLSEVINHFLVGDYTQIRPTVFKSTVKKYELMNLVANR
jgi:homoserine O-acetyltransferase